MLIGIPGSGKSYEAQLLSKEYDAIICSSDEIRKNKFNNEYSKEANAAVFSELHKKVRQYLRSGRNVIYDATNINSKKRMIFLKQELKGISCEKIAIIMATPYEQCQLNNQNREAKVPEEVIRRMYINWQTPYYYEGFDVIQIVLWDKISSPAPAEWADLYKIFRQDNPHHGLTLGEHCLAARDYIVDANTSKEIQYAALLHDCGKPFTKDFHDSKRNPTKEAHYYNHNNVGAYDSMFYMSHIKNLDSVLVSWLICNHMEPYFWTKSQGSSEKRRKLWGDELWGSINLIHEADVHAH